MDITFEALVQQLGIGLALAALVSWLFYKSLISRINILESIISRHDKRESIHLQLINTLIVMIPTSSKAKLTQELSDYQDRVEKVNNETRSK